MTVTQGLSIALLVLVLVVAVWRRMNIGVLALAAAVPILALSGVAATKAYTAFPGDLVVLIAGVSLLFAHVERSGALSAVVEKVYEKVGDRQLLLPWVGFVIAAALSSAGAFSTAPIAFLVPLVAYFGVRYRESFYLCELAVVIGANSAGLSPLNPTGASVLAAAEKLHVHYSTWGLWAVSMLVAAVVVLVLQVIQEIRRRRGGGFTVIPAPALTGDETPQPGEVAAPSLYRWCSGLALPVFLVLVLFAKWDVGFTAMGLVALLQIAFRPPERAILGRVPWSSILLLAGLLTYLGLMQTIGTMKSIEGLLHHLGTGVALVLVVSYMTALLCNIESSTLGVLNLMMPLVFTAFTGSENLFWIVCAVCVPAALSVMNPVHVAGTLIIANSAQEQQNMLFRKLFTLAVTLSLIVPGLLGLFAVAM
ncbi:SLC13 family permease [Nocardia alni]|uniref:SLC13 family permease n=1 Tax=Nocardia alni TaxID=2815723 RepID=UPI001C22CB46|nr:SLC13 family permease [Nocardia alni]